MGDLIPGRLEGAERISEARSPLPRQPSGGRARRRRGPPSAKDDAESELDQQPAADPETPPHKVDSLA